MTIITVAVTDIVPASIDKVWPVLEDFGNITLWVPGIDKVEVIGEGVGMIRRIYVEGLDEPIDEQLNSINAAEFSFSYAIPQGLPLPLSDYSASAKLKPIDDKSCEVCWQSNCIADGVSQQDAEAMIKATYQQLIDWLKAYF
ncbi:MAG: SRPBCC family protein [Pseudomonadales bacterium]|nr:SRPBCC family protein [Pseudomonadales bacterium]